MRILTIMPTAPDPSLARERNDVRLTHLRKLASPGTEIELTRLDNGPAAVVSDYGVALAAPYVIGKFKEAQTKGFDAVILSCGRNPGLYACRQIADIPVVGNGESSHLMAASLGHRYSIINHGEKGKRAVHSHGVVRNLGFESRVASFRGIGLPIFEIEKDFQKAKEMFIEEARKAIEEDGADVILPGCGLFAVMAKELQEELGVPVIDAAGAALKQAETLVSLGLRHSKIVYPGLKVSEKT